MLSGNGWIFNMQEEGFLTHVGVAELVEDGQTNLEKNKPGHWHEDGVL